jgi:probable HAF family extracellular repeat protein
MRSLGTLGGDVSEAFGVNTDRTVVGYSGVDATGIPRPFFWTPDEGMQALPTLGDTFGVAYSLNEFGHIVGVLDTPDNGQQATLWTPTPGPLRAHQATEKITAPHEVSGSLAPGSGRAA